MSVSQLVLTQKCSCRVILETDATTIAGRVAMRGPDDQMSISEQVSSPITPCIATLRDPICKRHSDVDVHATRLHWHFQCANVPMERCLCMECLECCNASGICLLQDLTCCGVVGPARTVLTALCPADAVEGLCISQGADRQVAAEVDYR